MEAPAWLWIVATLIASSLQTARNALQRGLIAEVGTAGATHVRFLFGLPFSVLFLAVLCLVTGWRPPSLDMVSLAWCALGALSQVAATALMLAAMKDRSFVVVTAYTKTEPVQAALVALIVLGEPLTAGLAAAVLIATLGVMVISWPKAGVEGWSWRPALLGIASGALFALAAVGFRGAVTSLGHPSFVMRATTTLVLGLTIQTMVMSGWLLVADRAALKAIFKAWRPSLSAGLMGAGASQFWFLAFAIQSVAKVRTLALVEVLLALLVSRKLFTQNLLGREGFGIALIVIGVGVLLNL